MTCQVHVDDIGTNFIVAIVDCNGTIIDVSSATTKKIRFTLPDKSTIERDAEFVTDGTDGKIKYVSVVDDISQAGRWKIQGFVIDPPFENNSEVAEFTVYANLS